MSYANHVQQSLANTIHRPSDSTVAAAAAAAASAPIVFAMVMFGSGSAQEGQHMVKSILMYSSRAVNIHILCTTDAMEFLQRQLDLVTRPAYDARITFYPLTEAAVVKRAHRAGIDSRHHAGVGGLVKMFMHEVLALARQPRAVYVDTDAVFAVDPVLLWRDFNRMPANAVVSFPNAGLKSNGAEICTCVMGLNLDAMRNSSAPLLPSTLLPATQTTALGHSEVWEHAKLNPENPGWGDQGLFWAIWQSYPDRFGRLSRIWDASFCRVFIGMQLQSVSNLTLEVERKWQDRARKGDDEDMGPAGIMWPGIIHFNCMGSEESVFETPQVLKSVPYWGPLVTLVSHYQWVWLNRGEPDSAFNTATGPRPRLVTHVVQNVRFLDEVLAETPR
ncbi:hypothetical protein BKA62DRAFT_618948 [Auriculariales sp. MPI-PUGE-AT-0066]|nr:hypothetical protein BKA62DRAFT_618948 [Auriculariales sp. MPI-PUGE-AT-0066]